MTGLARALHGSAQHRNRYGTPGKGKAKRGGTNKCQAKAKHRSARASLSNARQSLSFARRGMARSGSAKASLSNAKEKLRRAAAKLRMARPCAALANPKTSSNCKTKHRAIRAGGVDSWRSQPGFLSRPRLKGRAEGAPPYPNARVSGPRRSRGWHGIKGG